MISEKVLSLIEGAEIPSIPHVLQEILTKTGDPATSSSDLEKLIVNEPGLVTHLLKTANSAYFVTNNPIVSVNQAIVRLGFSAVRSVVSGLVLIDVFHNMPGLDQGLVLEVWRHSLSIAGMVNTLAVNTSREKRDILFLSAMVRDVGYLVLAQHDGSLFDSIRQDELFPRLEDEEKAFGVDHAAVGAALLSSWKFPESVVNMVDTHHKPDEFAGDQFDFDCLEIATALAYATDYLDEILAMDETEADPLFIEKLQNISWSWTAFQNEKTNLFNALEFAEKLTTA